MSSDVEHSLMGLLLVEKKRDLEKYAAELVITKRELWGLIAAVQMGLVNPYVYRRHHRDLVPDDVSLSRIDLSAIRRTTNDEERRRFIKADNMIGTMFQQRRWLVGHMLLTPDRLMWHFIYFDHRDLSTEDNHWAGGSHVHFVNYLWPHMDPDTLWEQFTGPKPHIGGALHVRFDVQASDYQQGPS